MADDLHGSDRDSGSIGLGGMRRAYETSGSSPRLVALLIVACLVAAAAFWYSSRADGPHAAPEHPQATAKA